MVLQELGDESTSSTVLQDRIADDYACLFDEDGSDADGELEEVLLVV